MNIGLIPARGGSKGLPGKNIKLLKGRPLIAYSIEAALKAKSVGRVFVSTDDEEISDIAMQYGAEVPFLRPAELARDDTPDTDVYIHFVEWLRTIKDFDSDILVLLRPTTPFKNAAIIDIVVEKLIGDERLTSVRTVSKVEGVFHPYWMFKQKDREMKPFIDGIDLGRYYQRQLLPECYRLNGVVDALRIDLLLKNKKIYGDHIGFVEVNDYQAIDVDKEFDFELCEFFMQKMCENTNPLT
ncbi:MAG: acylneuraminate cytidylyltransferase family protein [Candidatus Brocadiaceae bacterium]|nr:acylneuraminate cytidylyltransferase family protein [Candidatus Brocadiaceae bacterium]